MIPIFALPVTSSSNLPIAYGRHLLGVRSSVSLLLTCMGGIYQMFNLVLLHAGGKQGGTGRYIMQGADPF